MENITENVKIICLQTPIWKVSCHRSIISGLLGSFNGESQGFSMVCLERTKASRIVYISWLNKISSKGQIGSTCIGPLASQKLLPRKNLYPHVQKQLLYLLELNFERILHNTEYVLRCLKTVSNFRFSWFC